MWVSGRLKRVDGVALEVDLHEDGGLVTEHTRIMPGIHQYRLGCDERDRATVGILHRI